jgi:serine/threonine-protein kinase
MSGIPGPLAEALADRYRLERELGQGGMATVYLAQDLKHDRQVAIKVLKPELAAVLGTDRFLAEIKTTAALQHPHILPLFDSGAAGPGGGGAEGPSFLYYVMPLVAGESLRDRLDRDKQLSIADAVRIATEVASALDHAHRHGVIHRDIKPENILLHDGRAMVADFGIALAVQEAGGTRLTDTGVAVGTPSYMSPEQSMAERSLDGRTDIYALGCVLYEMLAGEPPYTGPTNQAIIAKRINHPVPSVRALRETVPESVDQALMSALAKSPADRFSTAAEFATALEGQTSRRSLPLRPSAPLPLLVALAAILTIIIGWIWWHRSHKPTTLDSNLLAIAPFEVHDPTLQLWHEGLVDVLARNLDGAGPLRTVPTSVVLRRWQGPADRATAAALGTATGAGLVAFGDLAVRGADSVTLSLTLLDVTKNTIEGEVEVSGPTDRINDLADSLGRRVLGALGRERPIAAVRQGPLGATSLPALKDFLQGEQWYRRGEWDSALVYYDEAISDDSTFSLALGRMALVLGWNPPTQSKYKDGEEYWQQAVRYRAGQSTLDSLIMAAGVLNEIADTSTNLAGFVDFHRRSLATVREAVRQYPADPEVWYSLGETLFHFPAQFRGTATETLAAFDHSIELDSGFVPAYEHTSGLAMEVGGVELARRYLIAYVRLNPTETSYSSDLRFQAAVFDPGQNGAAKFDRLLDSASGDQLFGVTFDAAWWPDSAETAVRVSRALLARAYLPKSSVTRQGVLQRIQILAMQLAIRGHLQDAWRLYDDSVRANHSAWGDNPFPELALLGVVPPETAAKVLAQVFEPKAVWPPKWHLIGLSWWAQQRDTTSLKRFIVRANLEAARATIQRNTATDLYLGATAGAYLILSRGDTAAALAALQALPDSSCGEQYPATCLFQKFTEARLLAAGSDERKAADLMDHWVLENFMKPTPVIVVARLERAQLAEHLGERELAIRYYQFVTDIWRNADPMLSPYVEEARAGLQRLTREPRP